MMTSFNYTVTIRTKEGGYKGRKCNILCAKNCLGLQGDLEPLVSGGSAHCGIFNRTLEFTTTSYSPDCLRCQDCITTEGDVEELFQIIVDLVECIEVCDNCNGEGFVSGCPTCGDTGKTLESLPVDMPKRIKEALENAS